MITFAEELRKLIGHDAVSTEQADRERASIDGSYLSPVISEQLPLGLADVVAYPSTADGIGEAVALAARRGIPITVRGKGTGNYGQAIPMAGGLVIDTTRARAIVEVGDGSITAEAGATMVALERAANKTDQQLWMYPSTAQSTLGGFLSGGSGGTGSIAHGMISDGFVTGLDIAQPSLTPVVVSLSGSDVDPYLHSYGTAGVLCRATVRLEPLQDWVALYASFADFADALQAVAAVSSQLPVPRLVSADPPVLAGALPADPAIVEGASSLRAIVDRALVPEATRLVEQCRGRVEAVRDGPQATIKLSMISYNHAIEWLQKAFPSKYFHLEVSGERIIELHDELVSVYPGGMLHIEGQAGAPVGLLAAEYRSAAEVFDGFAKLTELGIRYHNVHQWNVDFRPDLVREVAEITDPLGLLNPGKLVRDSVASEFYRTADQE